MGILRIGNIDIHRFRCFENVSFRLGRVVTVIAGHNATGKSTILALLGHCAELKKKDGTPILHGRFRTEYSEIIKSSREFDQTGSTVHTITMVEDDGTTIPVSFRATWQKHGEGVRYRLIPMKSRDRRTERKISWPTLYLGLSRLYPIGESDQATLSDSRLSPELTAQFFAQHKSILSLNDDPIDCSSITIKETAKKRTYGIKTATYDPIVNSAGQDNLSQILLAAMSFEVLKERRGPDWNGGLLLIDELDATLHPSAQNRLVKHLYDCGRRLGIQIVFTTHSLSLLEYVCERTQSNSTDEPGDFEMAYLTTRNGPVELIRNPTYDAVYDDMLITMSQLRGSGRRIVIYSEDAEARWFLSRLISDYSGRVRLVEASFGYSQLLKMLASDYDYFRNTLFVLDGDVTRKEIDAELRSLKGVDNIVILPGGVRPEQLFHTYLLNLTHDHEVLKNLASTGFSKRLLNEYTLSRDPSQKDREWYKQWFNEFREIIDFVYPYWESENRGLVDGFLRSFMDAFNRVAKRRAIAQIRPL